MILLIVAIILFLIIAFAIAKPEGPVAESKPHYTEPTINGYVYIIDNKLFPEYVKVGMTTRDPISRVREFNTAVPVNFDIKMEIPCPDPYGIEQDIHRLLRDYKIKNKEWFKIDSEKFNELMLTLPYFVKDETKSNQI